MRQKAAKEVFEHILQETPDQAEFLIKQYGKQCAEQALKDASDNIMYANDPTPLDIEQSILSTPIVTP